MEKTFKGVPFFKLLPLLRDLNGVSQRELAEQLQTTQTTISRYECGSSTPKAKIMLKLAQLFKIDILVLRESIKLQERQKSPNDPQLPEPSASAIDQFGDIPIKGAVSAGTVYDLYPEDQGTILENLGRSNFKNCFTVVVNGDSMEGRTHMIPDGALAVIDSGVPIDASLIGEVVCARLEGEEHVLKELVKHDGRLFLKSWNAQYPLIPVTSETRIEGVLLCIVQPAKNL